MSLVRTVSDTKRKFYTHHTRPINSIYRRVVEELLVEMHLLSVNVNFRYDPIYALGVVTSFDRFMQGYRPERDLSSIFEALCRAVESDPEQYRRDAEMVRSQGKALSLEQIVAWNNELGANPEAGALYEGLKAIAFNPNFKYSRLFALGLYSLLEGTNADWAKDEKQRDRVLQELSETLKLPADKIQKDIELYRSNLEKMAQVQAAIEDSLNADRKKRQQQLLEKSAPIEPSDTP
ncbi:photosystem II biogenesis protein Psp29 [Oscillatoria sp. FACHB-1406]|uniref:photosystem II biogenesis protein Psp29 n=1 Tax=Oscillatoria sp. FACHB-1406 TaxID=2692846 RepID=UPI00168446BF|nr:photosystem II biogenesis protein Psp29 [Oscillatoria sp. FACHB-1406]